MEPGFLAEISLIKRGTHDDLQRLARLNPALVSATELNAALGRVVDDRLSFARAFLEFAQMLLTLPTPDEMTYRNAIARSYYAVHHAARALVIFIEHDDPFGHIATADAVAVATKKHPRLREALGEDGKGRILAWQSLRNRADYSIYGQEDASEPSLDFATKAPHTLRECEEFVSAVETYVQNERSRS